MLRFAGLAGAVALALAPRAALAADEAVPDALSVEWQGKHPCEKLYEDAQIRVARCVFPPGAVHVKHQHPPYLTYVLEGGQGEATDARGTGRRETKAGQLLVSPAVPWHAFRNVGATPISYLLIERKYAAAAAAAP